MKFSIVTVCYNSEKTIEKTLMSLINQTYKKFELVIIDGNSKDRTLDIVNKYKSAFSEIKIVSERDNGIYDAMNKGINLATGDLIAFLNSDDYYDSQALQHIAAHYEESIDIFFGETYFIEEFYGKKYEKLTDNYDVNKLILGWNLPHTSCFVKTDIMKQFMFDDTYKISSDYKFMLSCYLNKYNFKYIPKRVNNMVVGGISTTQDANRTKEFIKIQKELLGYTNIKESDLVNITIKKYIKGILKRAFPTNLYVKVFYLNKGWTLIN